MNMPPRVLITGAATGFGRITAEFLAKRGYPVFAGIRGIAHRNQDTARELREWASDNETPLTLLELDVNEDDSVKRAIDFINKAVGGIDVLVNNAGLTAVGLTETFTEQQALELFETNVLGAHRMNRAVLPGMRDQGDGLIIHISSSFARFTVPTMGLYCASKAALESMAQAYRYELAPLGIDSVILEPGAHPTDIGPRIRQPADQERSVQYKDSRQIPERLAARFDGIFSSDMAPDPSAVSHAIAGLIKTPRGMRPLRTLVDPQTGTVLDKLNQATLDAQDQAMGILSLNDLPTGPRLINR